MINQQTDTSIRVLGLSKNQHVHYAPLFGHDQFEITETDEFDVEVVSKIEPDVVLTLTPEWFKSVRCIYEANKRSIPTLLILDGILEWRHQWTNPKMGGGGKTPFAQSIVTDKIACFGWQNARLLEAWGHIGKCEIVGIPRFDHYLTNPVARQPHHGPRRLLIMTANTPGFDERQVTLVRQALRDVRDHLAVREDWEPIWRVRGGLDQALNLTDRFPELRSQSLRDAFSQADAVLTTPSTVLIESMMAGLPTAILDYSNSPPYVPAAWMVTAQPHIALTLDELVAPPANRLAYQDEILHNQVECLSPATPRMINLITTMAHIGRMARASGQPLEFPARIIPLELGGHALPSKYHDLAMLYPDHPVFSNQDLNSVQFELTVARKELDYLHGQLAQRSLGFWFSRGMRRIFRIARR